MAAYNRADLIGTAIQSVLQQDFDDYELVIADDGSTDHTPQVVRGFKDAEYDTFVKSRMRGAHPLESSHRRSARRVCYGWRTMTS